jgi:hypothetical protein
LALAFAFWARAVPESAGIAIDRPVINSAIEQRKRVRITEP